MPHNFVMYQCTYNKGIKCIYDKYTTVNKLAVARLSWYEDYFHKIDEGYSFTFYFNHLDCFGKPTFLGDINAICFGCSVNSKNFHAIPILNAYYFWDGKKDTIFNLDYDLNFNNTPFDDKINKIVWRGSLCETFSEDFKLLHLRNDVCKKWIDNSNFDIGLINSNIYSKSFLNLNDFTKYKYVLNIDGYGASFDGTVWKLRSTSLVIWVTDPNNQMYMLEWYFPLLQPYVHYVPSSIDKLQETFEWCEANPEKCKKIIENANMLIKDVLQKTDEYHKTLFAFLDKV